MDSASSAIVPTSREEIVYALHEAAELEHNLMCTYLYAAFSLKSGEEEGLSAKEAEAVARWRRAIIAIAVDEMSHLVAVWNITAALGGAPRFGRANFPLETGYLPANVVVKLAPFDEAVIQHFIYLERPADSLEPDGEGFTSDSSFKRANMGRRLTPMTFDYDTVGVFYATLGDCLRVLVDQNGADAAFCGDPALQLSQVEVALPGAKPVLCLKTALAAFDAIIIQGEGAQADSAESHFQRFLAIREEYNALKAANPDFTPAHPAARNPVLRPPPRPEGRVWLEDKDAIAVVDLANACYGLMLRLLASAYARPSGDSEKALYVDLSIGLMRAVTPLAERAARLPAGPSNPGCNAGISFTALRDAAALPAGASVRRFFQERFEELVQAADALGDGDARTGQAARTLRALSDRLKKAPEARPAAQVPSSRVQTKSAPAEESVRQEGGLEIIEGEEIDILYEGKKCIHARYCVTKAPAVFLANVQGPWIHPNRMETEDLTAVAWECPSGAIRYTRKDGKEEAPPPVNLLAVREAGPYAFRADMILDGAPAGYRATLCRCGASKNKPFCDGSHHEVQFTASGEPPTGNAEMLAVRDGPLAIDPELDGPLQIRGNLEITSGTGRVVERVQSVRLCRCGGSGTKPFCDNTHGRIGFRST